VGVASTVCHGYNSLNLQAGVTAAENTVNTASFVPLEPPCVLAGKLRIFQAKGITAVSQPSLASTGYGCQYPPPSTLPTPPNKKKMTLLTESTALPAHGLKAARKPF